MAKKVGAIAVAEVTLSTAVFQLVINGGMAPAEFVSLVGAFGPLPEDGMHELARRMVASVSVYRLQQLPRLTPAKEGEQLERIANHARRLLTSIALRGDPRRRRSQPMIA